MSLRSSMRARSRWIGLLSILLIAFVAYHNDTSIAAQPSVVRLALVNVPDDVLRPLLPLFLEQQGKTALIVYTVNDPFAEG